jgi:hypothetical protein
MSGVVMRRTARWMQQLDERILEYLARDGWATPAIISREVGLEASKARIRERLRALRYAGFVAPFAGDCYELTTWGQLYLEGDLDAAHQPRPTRAVTG